MKEKIIALINKAYSNVWFNVASVMLSFALGLMQTWVGMAFVGLFVAGASVVLNTKPVVKKVTKKNK